jgi:hypothetical protein
MKLFKTYELEIISNRPIDKVIESLSEKASFTDNSFKIRPKVFSIYRGTNVDGQVRHGESKTTVKIRISMSADYKARTTFILLSTLIIPIMLIVFWTKGSNADIKEYAIATIGYISGLLILIGLMKLFYQFSVWIQRESLTELIKNG